MLDERKVKLVEMRIQGETITDIAKTIGVSRPTIYDWLNDPEVKNLIEETKRDIVEAAKNLCINHLPKYIKETEDVAFNSLDARSKLSALQSLTDRAMGKVATKIETTENKKDSISDDILNKAIDDVDNDVNDNNNDNVDL